MVRFEISINIAVVAFDVVEWDERSPVLNSAAEHESGVWNPEKISRMSGRVNDTGV